MRSSALCGKLGHVFRQPKLLERALTHRSYAAEHNERLEFLGDAILGCVIARHLYDSYPQLSEGDLSRLRSNLVREETLASLALKIDLGSHLKLGEGELRSGGARRPSILADALEALIGAVMLDADFAASEQVVLKLFVPYLEEMDVQNLGKDAKTLLQEFLQGKHMPLPNYNVIATQGEAHAQSFEVECDLPSLGISARGSGSSRRNAEQQAAQAAYRRLTAAK
ncbi:MAG TPA: ribonuclease III [Gallionella sp.]|nr:ribonuclease III [Gallionella sp.]